MLETDTILPSGLRRRTSVTGSILTVETTDPNADRALAANALMRSEGIVEQKDELRFELSIPEFAYYMLVRKYPDLDSHDADINARAWNKYIASNESQPYRVY